MKKNLFTALLLVSSVWSFGQTHSKKPDLKISAKYIEYQYDEAGNRISRIVGEFPEADFPDPILPNPPTPPEDEAESLSANGRTEGSYTADAFPNPTKGDFEVDARDRNNRPISFRLRIYDQQGKLIKELPNNKGRAHINIAKEPAGPYILEISNGEERQTLYIIKI